MTRAAAIPAPLRAAALACLAALAPALTSACAGPPGLSARMSDDEVRAVLAREARPGTPEPDLRATLDRLGAPARSRTLYPATESRPAVLLQRVYEGRGMWLQSDNDLVEYLDISLVLTPDHALERALLHRDKVRFVRGEAIIYPHAPRRKLAGPPTRWPGPLPPPTDPLEDAQ